jgi:hypothetical protein
LLNVTDGSGLWYQMLRIIAQEISSIPLGSAKVLRNSELFIIPDASLNLIQLETANWEVVVGGVGVYSIGESFVSGFNYYGSIDVVLVILALTVALPLAIAFVIMFT